MEKNRVYISRERLIDFLKGIISKPIVTIQKANILSRGLCKSHISGMRQAHILL